MFEQLTFRFLRWRVFQFIGICLVVVAGCVGMAYALAEAMMDILPYVARAVQFLERL